MYALSIIALVVCGGCLAAIQIKVWASGGSFWWTDLGRELDKTEKRLAIVAGISFLIGIVCLVLATT